MTMEKIRENKRKIASQRNDGIMDPFTAAGKTPKNLKNILIVRLHSSELNVPEVPKHRMAHLGFSGSPVAERAR